jgi:hypothetical protein
VLVNNTWLYVKRGQNYGCPFTSKTDLWIKTQKFQIWVMKLPSKREIKHKEQDVLDVSTWAIDIIYNNNQTSVKDKF